MRVRLESVISRWRSSSSAAAPRLEPPHVESVLAELRVALPVVAAGAHLQEDGLPLRARLRNEAQLLGGVLGEDVTDVDQAGARSGASHHVLVRTGAAFRFASSVTSMAEVGTDRHARNMRPEPSFPGRAAAALRSLADDLGVEWVRLGADIPPRAHHGLELRAAARRPARSRLSWSGTPPHCLVASCASANCASNTRSESVSLDEALGEPVQPRARQLLHPQNALRPVPVWAAVTRIAIDRRPFEIVLVVNAVRGPLGADPDPLGQEAREVAAAAPSRCRTFARRSAGRN